jgi:hypothetical protein
MKKTLLVFSIVFAAWLNATAQDNTTQPYLQFDFHKVSEDKVGEYLKIESDWKKVHEQQKKDGKIARWMLYEVMLPNGTAAEHNYITVVIYPKYEYLETIVPDLVSAFGKVYPDRNFGEYYAKTNQVRNRLRTEIFANTDGYWNPKAFFQHKYARLDYFKTDAQNPAAYLDGEINFWKPAHIASVEMGIKNGWQLCSKLYISNSNPYTHMTASFMTDFIQTNTKLSDFEKSVKKAFPTLSDKQLIEKLGAVLKSREFTHTELIKLIDSI